MSSKGLGRGLDALLRRTDMGAARQEKNDTPEKETGTEHSPTLLPLSHLHANPSQPRQTFDAESLAELAASIREQGIIQPLLVRPPSNSWQVIKSTEWPARSKAVILSKTIFAKWYGETPATYRIESFLFICVVIYLYTIDNSVNLLQL